MTRHVAVVHRKFAMLILKGEKTAELRLTKNRIAPFGIVKKGDTVFIKIASGPVCCRALVSLVEQHEGLTPGSISELRRVLAPVVKGDDAYWDLKRTARYATVIHLECVAACDDAPGLAEARAGNPRAAWLVLSE